MTIAIDYDNTWTRDPAFWQVVIELGRKMGHEFVMVTGRSDDVPWSTEVLESVRHIGLPVVFAGMMYKREAAEKKGWKPDVWIDDCPEYIGKQIHGRK